MPRRPKEPLRQLYGENAEKPMGVGNLGNGTRGVSSGRALDEMDAQRVRAPKLRKNRFTEGLETGTGSLDLLRAPPDA